MTQTKKILSILLSMILLFSVCPTGVFDFTAGAETVSGTCGDNLTWQYNTSTYTLTISGTGEMTGYSFSSYNGTYVTTAPWRSYYDTMKTVIINSGVTSIGERAFHYCTGLTSITIPDSVTSIGYSAFSGCTGLTSVTIPDSVTSLENYAFYDCTELTSITIGNSVTSIGDFVFSYCTGLTSITIPDSVTSIGYSAFSDCTGLTSITLPYSVTSIGYSAFSGCTSLNKVNISNIAAWCNISFNDFFSNPLRNAHNLYLNDELVTDLVIPNGVTSLGNYAFNDSTALTSITIPDSVTSIGYSAFSGCTGLTSVTIPDSVLTIEAYAFPKSTVIYGTPSTAAETFAINNGNRFVALPDYIKVFYVEKTDYYIGSTMDPGSVIIAVYFADGEVKLYYKNYTVSGFDTSTPGEKTVTVSYYGKKATFTINVSGATANDLTTLVDMMLGKGKADGKYDLNGDGNVNILDLIKMKKEIANM